MAMMRPRRPTLRTQPSFRPAYQDFKPKSEMSENPEAHLLLVHLPGFTRERVRVQYDYGSRLVRVSGERPIDGGNRRSRFKEAYPVPQNCNVNQIQSNFRQGILTIIMPKNIITQPEVKPTQEQAIAGSPTQKAEPAIPPKSATTQEETRDYQKTASSPSSSGKGPGDKKTTPSQSPVIDNQKPEKELTTAVAEKKAEGMPQKVTEETEPKPTLQLDQGKVEDEKPKKVQQEVDEKPQKGQEETEAKLKLEKAPRNKMDDEKPRKGQEETEPKPTSEMVPSKPLDEKPERGQEGTNQNATYASIPAEQSGEKPGERRGEDAEKERISDKEIIEEGEERISNKEIIEEGKPSESIKTGNGVKEKSMVTVTEKEITERRELVKAGEHSGPKIPEKGKKTTRKYKAEAPAEEWNLNDGMMGAIGNGIKEVTISASQAITRIAEGKWDNDDKPLLLNIGASILVLAAVGVYALYRFTSS
ncbi:hypothetical protein QN277_001949 [Acacia crassicarpa]|uniref:SHSP domain-containing protein n=1 Tax=Acacia crassicarpa TaxID=499986 RepID=A0AAE1N9E0_9FABA|nr:hypothetical protein QN277_001949 [Acacia crassicarpa]